MVQVTLQQHLTSSVSSHYIPTTLSSPPNNNVVVGSTVTVASNESPPQMEQQRLQSMSSSIRNDHTDAVGSCSSTNNDDNNNNVREEHHTITTTMLPVSSETSAWGNDESLRESKQDSPSWMPTNKSTGTTSIPVNHCQPPKHGFTVTLRATDEESSFTFNNTNDPMVTIGSSSTNVTDESTAIIMNRRPRSGSEGLDYLAFLAEQERRDMMTCEEDEEEQQQQQGGGQYRHQETVVVITPPTSLNHSASSSYTGSTNSNAATSDSDDTEMMPPPQPRRPRSISNPDSMMTTMYNLYPSKQQQQQQHFVLPPHLLKKELAEARGAVVRKAAAMIELDIIQRNNYPIPEHSTYNHNYHADYNNNDTGKKYCGRHEEDNNESNRLDSSDEYDDDDDEDEEDVEVVDNDYDNGIAININENISSAELLRLARSRLLEDLLNESSSSGLCNHADGTTKTNILLLPHNLTKYKTVYNQNGRIGIYTPQERAAIIERYLAKRMHRNWNKKIRYNCRKSLADRRLRVKGRFVKRSLEIVVAQQEQTAATSNTNESQQASIVANACITHNDDDDIMPDITDPDAGFCPTIDQPYRRLRRHTVT